MSEPGAPTLQFHTRDVAGALAHRCEVALSSAFRAAYRLEDPLGSGAMGVVYRATQLSTGRAVAVKFLIGLGPELLARFRAEGRLLAALHHPAVLQVFDVGEVGEHPYLVCELLGGGTLRERLAAGRPVAVATAIDWMRPVLEGLQACHDAGIVHRDFKPENVLFGEDGRPRLADLGIAKLRDDVASITATGALVGTPRYMSPEQLLGEVAEPAADIYAAGLVLHELLTGRVPAMGNTIAEIAAARRADVKLAGGESGNQLPRPLVELVERALAHDPARRPRSAKELAEALEPAPRRARREARVTSRPHPPAQARRARWRIVAAAALAVTVLTLGGGVVLRSRVPSREPLPEPTGASPGPKTTVLSPVAGFAAERELADIVGTRERTLQDFGELTSGMSTAAPDYLEKTLALAARCRTELARLERLREGVEALADPRRARARLASQRYIARLIADRSDVVARGVRIAVTPTDVALAMNAVHSTPVHDNINSALRGYAAAALAALGAAASEARATDAMADAVVDLFWVGSWTYRATYPIAQDPAARSAVQRMKSVLAVTDSGTAGLAFRAARGVWAFGEHGALRPAAAATARETVRALEELAAACPPSAAKLRDLAGQMVLRKR